MERQHLSHSGIMTYLGCPHHYLFKYICGIREPANARMIHGSSVHMALEYAWTNLRDKGALPHEEDVNNIFGCNMESEIIDETDMGEEKIGTLVETGFAVLKAYRPYMEKIRPMSVEEGFVLPLDDNTDLTGRIDLVTEGGDIVDTKVVGKAPTEGDLTNDSQMTMYSMAYRNKIGKAERSVQKHFLIRGKNPRIEIQKGKRTKTDHERLMRNIAMVKHAIANNIFYCVHDATNAWRCTKANCFYERSGYHAEVYKLGIQKFIQKYATHS